jgi:hypothetical protein
VTGTVSVSPDEAGHVGGRRHGLGAEPRGTGAGNLFDRRLGDGVDIHRGSHQFFSISAGQRAPDAFFNHHHQPAAFGGQPARHLAKPADAHIDRPIGRQRQRQDLSGFERQHGRRRQRRANDGHHRHGHARQVLAQPRALLRRDVAAVLRPGLHELSAGGLDHRRRNAEIQFAAGLADLHVKHRRQPRPRPGRRPAASAAAFHGRGC